MIPMFKNAPKDEKDDTSALKEQLRQPLVDDGQQSMMSEAENDELLEGRSVAVFKANLHLAFRTSFVCALISLPVVIPALYDKVDAAGFKAYLGMIPGGVALLVVFTIYQNVGLTIQLAWQGITGTLFACLFTFVMSAIMPNGAAGDDYEPSLVHSCNILFIFLLLWLNIPKNTRMFSLSYHVYFVMDFMNPATTRPEVFNTSWAMDRTFLMTSSLATTFVTVVIGCAIAVLTMMLPYPIKATTTARNSAVDCVARLTELVDGLAQYFHGSEPSVKIAQLESKIVHLQSAVSDLMVNVDASWWETLDICRAGKIRELLSRHSEMLGVMVDNVFAMQICISKEDFQESHTLCMNMIDAEVHKLIDIVKELLVAATQASGDGSVSPSEENTLRSLSSGATKALEDLALAFDRARKKICPHQVINAQLQSESFYVYCLSVYARNAIEYTDLLILKPPKPLGLFKTIYTAAVGTFDRKVLMNGLDVHSFTIRNTISVVGTFYMGYFWLGYNATAAGTVSLLISEFSGSALQKNMGRLQAVVIGAIVPHIIMQIIGHSCDGFFIGLQILCLFLFEFLTCYIYYSSKVYGYIGCLTAAFGLSILMTSCTVPVDVTYNSTAYTKITNTTIAVIAMTLVDMILSPERASTGANRALVQALLLTDAWWQAALLPRKKDGRLKQGVIKSRADLVEDTAFAKKATAFTGRMHANTIQKVLADAASLGEEANKEPRYHRAPWPMDFFTFLIRQSQILRADLNILEQVLMGSKAKYNDVFTGNVRDLKAFRVVQSDCLQTMADCILLVELTIKNETSKPMPHLTEKLSQLEKMDSLEALPELFDQINGSGYSYPAQPPKTLEDDSICRLNVVLMLFDSAVELSTAMVKECIRTAS
eukprot:TRINITY_DN56254_c0_g1_i1.p1 TRINITY_DN56254_c0_g1~~TRINITY_DN56254_c0_g1_i1.p1  ORF type:complete len:882 (+),score=135.34 TRINITY_DN56254_c0_g1_i1:109-2754(+)